MPIHEDLDALLASPHAHQVFKRVRDRIFEHRALKGPFAAYEHRLTPGERIVLLVNAFVWDVDNGGMNQVLGNSTGDHAEELRGHLRALGALEAAQALDEISRRIYAGGPIPVDSDERRKRLFAWEELDEAAAEDFFDSLVFETEDILTATADYIRANRNMFD
ncbi:MAG TPA: DUF4375 domain-containing protein [Polyangiaceae bacterium]